MPRYVATVGSGMKPEALFDYMADFASAAEWDPSVVSAERLDSGGAKLGSRFRIVVKLLGSESPFDYEVIEYVRPNRVVVRAETDAVSSLDEMTIEPRGEGSALTYDAQLELKGPRKLLAPVMAVLFRRLGDNAKAGLERELNRPR